MTSGVSYSNYTFTPTYTGEYHYFIGDYDSTLTVTSTGGTETFDYLPLVLIFITIILTLLWIGSQLGKSHAIVSTILMILPLFFLVGLAQIGKAYVTNSTIASIITPIQIILPFVAFGFMLYVSINLVMKVINDISSKRKEEQGYD
jgi:hypothetical protein